MISLDGFGIGSYDEREEPRHDVQFKGRLIPSPRLSFDSLLSDDESVSGVTITNISQDGLATRGNADLVAGSIVRFEVPLIGWRDAEVRWIDGERCGCRFLEPLTHDELHAAIVGSPVFKAGRPPFVSQMAG
jgi:hypothetical protein